MHFDVILRRGELIDGTGAARFEADLGVTGERIAAIGDLGGATASHTLDAGGLVVAPGFIDSHTHDDAFVLTDPDVEPKVAQGVTTVIAGNCGISLAPLLANREVPQPLDLLGAWQAFRFPSFRAYLDALDATPAAVNTAALIGHSTLRVRHMADLDRAASAAEIAAMAADVREAMAAGAFGVSSGTFYPPAAAAPTEELIDVCAPLRETGGVFATHLRDETDAIIASLDEAFSIGRALDVRVVLSHHKVAGKDNHGRSAETLAHIDARRKLQPLCLDCHPYPATSTMLRADRVRQSSRVILGWSKPHPELAGRDFHELLPLFGNSVDATIDALRPAGAIYFVMDEADVERIIRHELTMVGSDGLPNDKRPHPRLWGTFPRVLGEFSRERGLFPLETAVRKMTGLTAEQFGIARRGRLAVGHYADLVVFDPARVIDRATFASPTLRPEGIEHVFVNGRAVLEHGRHTGARPGRALRRDVQDRLAATRARAIATTGPESTCTESP
ncbi:D-aminoacylase [Burkholderia cenocepacia]|uniref:N-acyl-D-amino-acid deacylase family protein n=1 Tax=Burkholderia cenocepacia TaxID=95486 RepID=UPI00196ABBEC|nr:D-aminoacylase [Burkholderia cenocepacia]MBN3528306.1 D-aminoacylase [Burkholderia cenocepacia]MBR7907156.1 D-aminoacylase [Burkholderia cenocepacia]MBR8023869.1 D-aminoacylase [Burkholderia cenocepacia]MBR8167683.1 D-aminoacylase [Burkholderia cenocepacia]MBR8423091.1 D-aminoacylase [Burkholderia cenocepacia]